MGCLTAALGLLLAVCAVAGWLPARRAARVNPPGDRAAVGVTPAYVLGGSRSRKLTFLLRPYTAMRHIGIRRQKSRVERNL
jgi:hypothetical protein